MRMRRIKLTLRINDDHMLCLCLNKNRLIPFSPSIFARQSGAGRRRLCQAQEDNLSLSKNHGVVKGWLPIKLYSGSDGMHVRTDESPKVFVLKLFKLVAEVHYTITSFHSWYAWTKNNNGGKNTKLVDTSIAKL